ncbi:MAG: hypothetical protein ACYDIC_02180 [Desulfobaccales bacterium]
MWFTKRIALGLCLALLMVGGSSCVHRPLPAPVSGVTLQPGRYLEDYYRAPGFAADRVAYTLEPLIVEEAQGIDPATFRDLLQAEMSRAWEANGLKLQSTPSACRVSGTVWRVRVKGETFRFFTGKISAQLEISGAITRGDETLFAFSDRVEVSSPVNPGPPAPKERELLLRQTVQAFLNHLLTELLLQGVPEPEG